MGSPTEQAGHGRSACDFEYSDSLRDLCCSTLHAALNIVLAPVGCFDRMRPSWAPSSFLRAHRKCPAIANSTSSDPNSSVELPQVASVAAFWTVAESQEGVINIHGHPSRRTSLPRSGDRRCQPVSSIICCLPTLPPICVDECGPEGIGGIRLMRLSQCASPRKVR